MAELVTRHSSLSLISGSNSIAWGSQGDLIFLRRATGLLSSATSILIVIPLQQNPGIGCLWRSKVGLTYSEPEKEIGHE
jgi:hypothetical protein